MSFALNIFAKPAMILVCAAALSVLLRRSSASVRHAVWVVAIAGAALLPIAAMLVPPFTWFVLPDASINVTVLPIENIFRNAAEDGSKTPAAFRVLALLPAFIWVLGGGFLLVRSVSSRVAVGRIARAAVPRPQPGWLDLLEDLAVRFQIRRPVRLVFSAAQMSPMTWGLFRHTILMPSAAALWTEERRRLVLAHELAHVKRRDGLIQILCQAVCLIYWFNPLFWYAAHRVRIERERACDDHVLSLGAAAADYADHLMHIVRELRAPREFSYGAIAMARPSQIAVRVASILDSRARRQALSTAGTALLCAFSALFTISAAAITGEPIAPPQQTRIGNGDAVPNNAVTPPRVLQSSPPEYTQEAVLANVEGIVVLEAEVDIDGNVKVLRVIKGLGHGLDEKATEAVLRWRFGPALRNGAPAAAVTQVDVDFQIPSWYRSRPQDETPPIPIGPGVTPPSIIKRVEPEYPPEARAARYEATGVFNAIVHKDGTVVITEPVPELEYGLTVKAAEALEQWRFKPAMRNGEAVSVSLKIEVNFHLR